MDYRSLWFDFRKWVDYCIGVSEEMLKDPKCEQREDIKSKLEAYNIVFNKIVEMQKDEK